MSLKQYTSTSTWQGRPLAELARQIGLPIEKWHHNCHGASVALVKARTWPGARVVRGWREGIGGQHSWVISGAAGDDVYDPHTLAIDLTSWSYRGDKVEIDVGTQKELGCTPHGSGSIWGWGRPERGDGPDLDLNVDPESSLGGFLKVCFPDGYDRKALMRLASAPVQDWPAKEFYAAMVAADLEVLLPIDVMSHLLDNVPNHGSCTA